MKFCLRAILLCYLAFTSIEARMKLIFFIAISMLLFCFSGCTASRQSNINQNANLAATPQPTVATSTPSTSTDRLPDVQTAMQKNLLAFGAGTMIVSSTSESKAVGEGARCLIDESPFVWISADGQIENQSVTLDLPARTTLKTIGFDTSQPTYYDHRAAKDVTVEISDVSASEGFQTILVATLKEDTDKQNFPVEREVAGRFVRFTAKNSYGSPKAILIKEIRGYGDQEARQPMANVSGTYQFEDYGELHLKQEGASIIGCYTSNQGIVEGSIDGRAMTLTTTESGNTKGFASVNFTDGGKKFISTLWSAGGSKEYDILRRGEKRSDKIGNCNHLPTLDGASTDAAKDQLEKNLKETGRSVLYGINFDFNSDKIRDESRPTLDKVVAILKERSDWRVLIEGHTDNIGGESFNQTLSEKRAAAVRNYFVNAGIDVSRLRSAGLGLSRPVATNENEAGRAQNRRVELIKP
jgi:outer membrane protein OmpA-like peptidoglycan-associated protein